MAAKITNREANEIIALRLAAGPVIVTVNGRAHRVQAMTGAIRWGVELWDMVRGERCVMQASHIVGA